MKNMEELLNVLVSPSGSDFFYLFLKAFAVLFSVLYLVYAIVITRQTQTMNKTFATKLSGLIFFISFFQIFAALALIGVALFII